MKFLSPLRALGCSVCKVLMDEGAFSQAQGSASQRDRRCLLCEGYERSEAFRMLDPIAPLLHVIGAKTLLCADLPLVVSNLMAVIAFRG
jgi:hypothetical protein